MPSFKDASGREYEATITLATAIKLQKIGVNLNKPVSIPDAWNSDLELLGDTIWFACEKSFREHGYDEKTFAECLAGDAITDATEAVWESIILFSQPSTRTALQKLWGKGKEVTELAATKILASLDQTTAEQILISSK